MIWVAAVLLVLLAPAMFMPMLFLGLGWWLAMRHVRRG